MTTVSVYVGIGNSDDKLSQAEWSNLVSDVHTLVMAYECEVRGIWYSSPESRWQNACISFEMEYHKRSDIKFELIRLAKRYRQDRISWAESAVEFLTG